MLKRKARVMVKYLNSQEPEDLLELSPGGRVEDHEPVWQRNLDKQSIDQI